MTTYHLVKGIDLEGPAGCTVVAALLIEFTHHKAEPDVGAPEHLTIENIDVLIGAVTHEFNGDYSDADLVADCWQHLADEKERIECERADMHRDERGAQ
ncbi:MULTISPECIES: hypothetical protein [Achromobacter]|uniref:hypothetical protein n=1 Tax=Achromobacter TaxID=222 RepID=UPI001F1295AC|nr:MULTISPECIES: hypothetical protein [Achromobacter]